MRLRYRFVVALAAALLGTGWSFGSTVHAATTHTAGASTVQHPPSGGNGSKGGWKEPSHSDCCRDHRDFREDRREDRFHDRGHCCDHFNDHCCDNGNHDNSNDCDWLRDHDHDAWLRDCQH